MSEQQVTITIDLDEDFDGIDLENALDGSPERSVQHHILKSIYNKWVIAIGKPEWIKP